MVFNMGRPTIRWVGNEDGLAAESTYYAVSGAPGSASYTDAYLAAGPRYLPPECDVSIRRGLVLASGRAADAEEPGAPSGDLLSLGGARRQSAAECAVRIGTD